ncbi:FAD-dependent oxidoreductase [Streptoalloteichus hindustanus]|uniref:2-polyprenyl-6-methoxyphenol hydroxylase n=1 Tax=Streptoalloteichus hindustanus TaxID=2017 RepID=A0A1M5CRJ3_STRHI|nr:FAD-dependent oxidoreductase [Streptoalloteichus hindustanus]SHF57374.1 2-polyprenyl-6-methoxyphenol hydroxylase [Streptoalloteichus hindustanus]
MAGRTVIVVGGGIGGLATAVALHRRGWRVTVLERAAEFAEVGAGLSLWPNAMRALAAIGLAERVSALGAVEAAGGVRDRAGRWLSRMDNTEIARRHGWPMTVVHRADLMRALVEALPSDCLRSGCEMRAGRDNGDAVVVEHSGGTLRADLVVGADGLRSAVRRHWWPDAEEPRYVGSTAWRMITEPLDEVRTDGAVFWGRGERFGFTRLPGQRFYCFATAALPAGAAAVDSEHAAVRRRFGDWPDPIPALLSAVSEESVLRHDVYDLPPVSTFVRGRVVLLGDAAHAMDPVLGQGACQALEDAVTLAACLDTSPDVAAALGRYDRSRRPRTQGIVRRSARLGALAQWSWPPVVWLRDLATRLTPATAALRSMAPVLGWEL